MTADDPIARAVAAGQSTLSEHDSKRLLARYGLPVCRETLVRERDAALEAARRIGYPVALKACAADIAHKTERGLVELGIGDDTAVAAGFDRLTARAGGADILVQEMVAGRRELMLGMLRDPQYGPCVSFGLGGVFAEALDDIAFRVAPLTRADAAAMLDEIRAAKVLGAVRGMLAVDRDALCDSLIALGRIGLDHPEIREIDVNPMIIAGARPVVVDALVVLG